jgi:hypothetical protein
VRKPVKVISGGEQGRMIFGKLMLMRAERAGNGRTDQPPRHGIDRVAEHRAREVQGHADLRLARPRVRLVAGDARSRNPPDGKMVNYLGNYEEYLASQGIA